MALSTQIGILYYIYQSLNILCQFQYIFQHITDTDIASVSCYPKHSTRWYRNSIRIIPISFFAFWSEELTQHISTFIWWHYTWITFRICIFWYSHHYFLQKSRSRGIHLKQNSQRLSLYEVIWTLTNISSVCLLSCIWQTIYNNGIRPLPGRVVAFVKKNHLRFP